MKSLLERGLSEAMLDMGAVSEMTRTPLTPNGVAAVVGAVANDDWVAYQDALWSIVAPTMDREDVTVKNSNVSVGFSYGELNLIRSCIGLEIAACDEDDREEFAWMSRVFGVILGKLRYILETGGEDDPR